MRKHIFIYEPNANGHHPYTLRALLSDFEKHRDWRTTILTSEDALRHPSFKPLVAEFKNQLELVVAQPPSKPSLVSRVLGRFYSEQYDNSRSLWREFRILNAHYHFDFAIVPYMEAVGLHNLVLWPHFGSVPWAVVPHGLRIHFRQAGIKSRGRWIDALQRLCFLQMLQAPTLAGVFARDPYLVRWANHPKVIYGPSPSKMRAGLDPQISRRSLGLSDDAMIVLVYGVIDGRKCLDLLLPAVALIDPGHKVVLLVAGSQDRRLDWLQGEAATRLRQESRLVVYDGYVTDEVEQMLFSSSDIVWCYYRDQVGSSAVHVKAGQYCKPVIANDEGLTGKIVSDHRCGLVVSRPEPAAIAQAILDLAASSAARKEMGERAFARFSKHTPEAFSGPIVAAIEASSV